MTYASAVLADSPLLYFRLDEASGSWVDSGSNGVSATRLSGATAGGAATSDGGTSYSPPTGTNASLGTVSSMPALSGASTVEFWLFLPTGNQSGLFTHVGGANGWTTGVGNTAQWQAGRNLVLGMTNVGYTVTSYAFPNVSGWRHVVVSKDAGNNYIAYVDGKQVASGAFSAAIQTPTAGFNWGGDNGLPMSGQVYFDEVAAYSGQLSAARVLTHYNARLGVYAGEVLADAPLAYYRLGEASGSTAADASGNGHNGTYTGGVTLGTLGLLINDADTAVTLNGSTGYVTTPFGTWLNTGSALTVEARVNPTSAALTGTHTVVSAWLAGDSARFILWLNGGKAEAYIYQVGTGAKNVLGTTTLVAGTAYTVAMRYDGAALSVWVNGVKEAEISVTGAISSAVTSGSPPLDVGRVSNGTGGAWGAGTVDEVAVYGTALSDARMLTHHIAAVSAGPNFTGAGTLTALATSTTASGAAALTGSGALSAEPRSFFGTGVFAGAGALSAVSSGFFGTGVFAGSGTLTASGILRLTPALTVSPLTAELGSTPGSVIVTVANGTPGDSFTAKIGSTTLTSGVLDETGIAFEVSIPIPALSAGTYTLVFTTGGGRSATISLAVLADALVTSTTTKPAPTPPTTTVTQRWRLFYLDGTLGYTFTRNPKSWTNVHPPNDFTHDNTTAPDGQILTWQAAARPWRMEFVGFVDSQAEYEAFVFWSELRRRFWLVDHRNRKWLVTFEQFDAQALIKPNRPWAHDYTMKTLVFAQG